MSILNMQERRHFLSYQSPAPINKSFLAEYSSSMLFFTDMW